MEQLFGNLGATSLFLSAVSVGEIYHGIHKRGDSGQQELLFRSFLANVDVVPFDFDAAVLFGALRFRLRRAGIAPGDPDIMIAATAIHHDLTLVTHNRKHFDQIEGLKLYDWSESQG
jgi:predicted nucleic acid-binding protein